MPTPPTRSLILGVPVDSLSIEALHDRLREFVRTGARATILHVNAHAMNLAAAYPWFGEALRQADVVLCDGSGIQLAARLLGQPVPSRITYADWTWHLAAWCERERRSLFFLGAQEGVAQAAAERLRARYPALRVVGTHHGFFDQTHGSAETARVLRLVNTAKPDLLIVGFGMPAQEAWVRDHRDELDVPVVLTGGAVFDYVSGRVRRAPRWMTDRGWEWLGRLAIEPRRLVRRYLVGNPMFLGRVVGERLRRTRPRER